MSFSCTFYKFSKKENSIKRPLPLEAGMVEMQIELKDSCSVVNPVLLIKVPSIVPDIFMYNYCYIPEFRRYYYIDDWSFNSGLWAGYCHVDPLASWRDYIRDASLYVMRSTYDANDNLLYDGNIADAKYPVTAAQPTYRATSFWNPYAGKSGMVVVGIISGSAVEGSVTYYCFSFQGFRDFCYKLFTYGTGWLNIDPSEISEALQKALINPFQYVVSCLYLPIEEMELAPLNLSYTYQINFGWWTITTSYYAYILGSRLWIRNQTNLPIPRHPETMNRGYYLNLSPYSIYTLRYYPYGTINIDSEAISNYSNLQVFSDLDLCTGRGILNICADGLENPIRTIEAQVGVQIPTASLQTNFQTLASGKTAIVAAGAEIVGELGKQSSSLKANHTTAKTYDSGFKGMLQRGKDVFNRSVESFKDSIPTVSEIKQTASDIMSSAIAASTTAEIQGIQGVGSGYDSQNITLSGRFLPIAAEDLEHTGRPLMQQRLISSMKGFVIVKDADIEIPCTDRELKTIKAYLENGFYVE